MTHQVKETEVEVPLTDENDIKINKNQVGEERERRQGKKYIDISLLPIVGNYLPLTGN